MQLKDIMQPAHWPFVFSELKYGATNKTNSTAVWVLALLWELPSLHKLQSSTDAPTSIQNPARFVMWPREEQQSDFFVFLRLPCRQHLAACSPQPLWSKWREQCKSIKLATYGTHSELPCLSACCLDTAYITSLYFLLPVLRDESSEACACLILLLHI